MKTSDEILLETLKISVCKIIESGVSGYNSPIGGLVSAAVDRHKGELAAMIEGAIAGMIADPEFKATVIAEIREKAAKQLISKSAGDIEKRLNELRSDPVHRARIDLALAEFVKAALPK